MFNYLGTLLVVEGRENDRGGHRDLHLVLRLPSIPTLDKQPWKEQSRPMIPIMKLIEWETEQAYFAYVHQWVRRRKKPSDSDNMEDLRQPSHVHITHGRLRRLGSFSNDFLGRSLFDLLFFYLSFSTDPSTNARYDHHFSLHGKFHCHALWRSCTSCKVQIKSTNELITSL